MFDGDDAPLKVKIVVIGGPNVGKTSIIRAYVSGETGIPPPQTVQLAFSQKTERIGDSVLHLQICDTAGEERFQSVSPNFYRDADAALLVFDLTSALSFDKIGQWINELNATMPESFVLLLVGNKTDLADQRKVEPDTVLAFTKVNDLDYLETSARTRDGIDIAFQMLCDKILVNRAPKSGTFHPAQRMLDLDANPPGNEAGSCC
jgi:small GTP-binding protein